MQVNKKLSINLFDIMEIKWNADSSFEPKIMFKSFLTLRYCKTLYCHPYIVCAPVRAKFELDNLSGNSFKFDHKVLTTAKYMSEFKKQ